TYTGDIDGIRMDHISVFFNEGSKGRYVGPAAQGSLLSTAGTWNFQAGRRAADYIAAFIVGVSSLYCQKPRQVPRTILVDLNLSDLHQVTASSDGLGSLYRPEAIIANDEGSGNCYARAFHTEGPDLAEHVLETIRKE
ncbi:hypothetical protein FOZ63_022280, partial [Perkinsus olseni]